LEGFSNSFWGNLDSVTTHFCLASTVHYGIALNNSFDSNTCPAYGNTRVTNSDTRATNGNRVGYSGNFYASTNSDSHANCGTGGNNCTHSYFGNRPS
jgi:hypothetical protein